MYDKLQSCYLTKRAYDAKGRLIEEIDSHNTKTVYTYDGLDRITKQETTNGENRSIFHNYYNLRNNVELFLDAENMQNALIEQLSVVRNN